MASNIWNLFLKKGMASNIWNLFLKKVWLLISGIFFLKRYAF